DFVREQLTALLPPGVPGYDITDQELLVWTSHRNGQAIAYDLGDGQDQLWPRRENGQKVDEAPVLSARRLFFSRVPLTWQEWVEFWQKDHEGQGHPHLLSDSVMLIHLEPEHLSPRIEHLPATLSDGVSTQNVGSEH